MHDSISVIIRTKNESRYLGRVLEALEGQEWKNVEVILVDSGSSDDTVSVAETFGCRIVRIKPQDFSFGSALNTGIAQAQGEIVVSLSGHSIPTDNRFLTNLVAPYGDPMVMATFGRNAPFPDACPSEARDIEDWYPDEWIDAPERFSNGNASFRKSAWAKIPFDERVSGSEDILWAKQILNLGFQITYVPSAAVYHSHSASIKYAFVRRFRETKAMVINGQGYSMSFVSFIKWTGALVLEDLRYAGRKKYRWFWYFHIPFYRAFQGFAIYVAARERKWMKKAVRQNMASLKLKVASLAWRFVGNYRKSLRVVSEEGWRSFVFKAKRKILFKVHLLSPLLADQECFISDEPRFPTARNFRVLFLVDPLAVLTNRYRAHNMKEYLGLAGIESEVVLETELNSQRVASYDVVVLCRVFMNPHIERLVALCRTLKIPVVFDVDDFVLDTSIIDNIAALQHLSEHEKDLHREGIRKHRGSFDAADFFIAPTDYLAEAGRQWGKTSFVIRNGISSSEIELAARIATARGAASEGTAVKIGYFSGTRSHQKDFSVAVPALRHILEAFPSVHLYIGGHLELDDRLVAFHDRIRRLPFVEMPKLPHNIAKVDINIAPLEVGNPFCEAKSELKYFDAGLLGIPTVASPTDAFRWAIRSGVNGFLASSTDEWYGFLKRLIEDAELRRQIGQKAHGHVTEHYAPRSMSGFVRKVYEEIISTYRERIGISERALKVSFIVPPPIQGSGGHNKIFAAAKSLSELGHSVTLYFLYDGTFKSPEQLRRYISDHFFDPGCGIVLGTDTLVSCDILCATSWMTAYAVRENKERAARLFYFVQDMEHLFFPMSDNYLKAENTYKLGMYHISYGPWCAKVIREKYGGWAAHVPFSLDKRIYHPRPVERETGRHVVFFARPEMPRRCFWLGVEALHLFYQRNPGVKVSLFGSSQIDGACIPFPFENLGVLSTERLAALYSGADVGIAFSTTNPSLVPFEMMACRCPVVDLDYNDNYINYGSRQNAKLVGTSPEAIATGLEEIINDEEMRDRIAENGFQFVSAFPDDQEAFRVMEDVFNRALCMKESFSEDPVEMPFP